MIRNILFDFGNVLFDLDLGRTGQQLRDRLGEHFDDAYRRLTENRIFELYEVGGLSTEEFVQALRYATGGRLDPQEVVAAWNAIFRHFPAARLEMLLHLRQRGYRVFLLSNINELHAAYVTDYLLREHGIRDFEARYFDGVYYSHLIRLRKPDREFFEYALADAELSAEACLFVDDLEVNVQAARDVGIQAVLHEPGTEIEALIEGYLS